MCVTRNEEGPEVVHMVIPHTSRNLDVGNSFSHASPSFLPQHQAQELAARAGKARSNHSGLRFPVLDFNHEL